MFTIYTNKFDNWTKNNNFLEQFKSNKILLS